MNDITIEEIELDRQYREHENSLLEYRITKSCTDILPDGDTAGIYGIWQISTGKYVYVGYADNINERIQSHFDQSNSNKKKSRVDTWLKANRGDYEYKVLEKFPFSCHEYEQKWINKLHTSTKEGGFNKYNARWTSIDAKNYDSQYYKEHKAEANLKSRKRQLPNRYKENSDFMKILKETGYRIGPAKEIADQRGIKY
jgi:hypothetical protein